MGAAESVKNLVPYWKRRQVHTVLDYGAGNLRNSCFLKEQGFQVVVVETPEHLDKIREKISYYRLPGIGSNALDGFQTNVDLVLANFVLNIIDDAQERKLVVANVYRNLRPGGFFLAEVKEKQNWKKGKGFSEEELDRLVMEKDFQKRLVFRRRGLLAVLYRKVLPDGPAGRKS